MTDTLSIYKSPLGETKCMAVYEAALARWPVPHQQYDLSTRFGTTRAIASGPVDAPPLILLHGQWATATMWRSTIEKLSREHRTFAIDQVDDVGKSTLTCAPASRADYADWLGEVFDALELPQADMAGLSYGGFLALNFALCSPKRVTRLALLCPGLPAFGSPTLKWALHGLPMVLFPSRLTAAWLVQGMSVKPQPEGDLEAEQIMAGAAYLRNKVPLRPVIGDQEFRNLRLPVLLLIGEKESMYQATAAVQRARQLIPQVQAFIIPNAGHMLTSDQPETVNSHLAEYFRPEVARVA